jgi:hypothetical protein
LCKIYKSQRGRNAISVLTPYWERTKYNMKGEQYGGVITIIVLCPAQKVN